MYSHLSIVIFLYFPAYLGRIILVFSTLFLKNIWSFSLESKKQFWNFLCHLLKYARSSLWNLYFQVSITMFFAKMLIFLNFDLNLYYLVRTLCRVENFIIFFMNNKTKHESKFRLYFYNITLTLTLTLT